MKNIFYILFFLSFFSCDYIRFQSEEENSEPPIASVYGAKLFKKDIESILPKNISKEDSLVFVKGLINTWAKKQLLLRKAEVNISANTESEISNLVKEYREGLLVNRYKEQLVKQQLDTVISEDEIIDFYKKNASNFKLNEDLVQLKYVHIGKDFLQQKKIIQQFSSDKQEDLEELESQTINFKSYQLRDSTWLTIDKVLLKIPPFQSEPKEKLLKISKLIQKEDSLGLYLVAVKNVLNRNDLAPLSYIMPTIKQMILHKRKLELIREIEKTLINDAIENKSFKEY